MIGSPRCVRADLVEERHPFLAAGRLAPEVHVLDDEVDGLPLAARASPSAGDAAPSTRAPCSDSSTSKAVRTASLSSMTRMMLSARLERGAALGGRRWYMARDATAMTRHTVRVATEGDTRPRAAPAARQRAGRSPQSDEHAADQVVEIQARQLVLMREPVADAERQRAADEDAGAEDDQAVLDQEVRDDVALARADGAPGADLLRAGAHVESGEPEDAEAGDGEHQRGDQRSGRCPCCGSPRSGAAR